MAMAGPLRRSYFRWMTTTTSDPHATDTMVERLFLAMLEGMDVVSVAIGDRLETRAERVARSATAVSSSDMGYLPKGRTALRA